MVTKWIATIAMMLAFILPAWGETGTLTWDANTEGDLAGYRIYQSNVSGQYAAPLASVGKTITSYAVTLVPTSMDQRFFFVVTAFDLAGNESKFSSEVNKLIAAVPVPVKPGVPVLHVTARTTTTLTVTYDPVPDGLGGSGVANVAIRIALAPISWGSAQEAVGPCPASPCVITGLAPDTSFDLQAVAYRGTPNVNAVFGALSAITTIKTLPIDAPPAPVKGLTISKATADEVVIVAKVSECPRVTTSTKGSTAAVIQRTVTCNR
jgi:hypothetical protein